MALPDDADEPSDFRLFCKNASDTQLTHILKKEWTAGRNDDYRDAREEAESRGWTVRRGERI
jgi:hypothetical protein